MKSGELIRALAERSGILPSDELAAVMDLRKMTEIGIPGVPGNKDK